MLNRVLIADDHALVREGIGILIARGGFNVVAEASNGQEALTHASSHQPDMAVLDMSMPIMNGLETAQELRRLSPRTKSIVLSNAGFRSSRAKKRNRGSRRRSRDEDLPPAESDGTDSEVEASDGPAGEDDADHVLIGAGTRAD